MGVGAALSVLLALAPMGKLLRTTLIAATLALVAPAYSQVRVISGDTEHNYGQGGQLLDDAELRARNESAERAKIMRLREREDAMRQQELMPPQPPRQLPQLMMSRMAQKTDHTTSERFAAGRSKR
jgi:hypothetical protein